MIPTLRSLPDPQALRGRLSDVYGLDFTGCTLLRSLVNDVYELTTAEARYVLKLYRADGRSAAEIRWETGLSHHLLRAEVAVPASCPRRKTCSGGSETQYGITSRSTPML